MVSSEFRQQSRPVFDWGVVVNFLEFDQKVDYVGTVSIHLRRMQRAQKITVSGVAVIRDAEALESRLIGLVADQRAYRTFPALRAAQAAGTVLVLRDCPLRKQMRGDFFVDFRGSQHDR